MTTRWHYKVETVKVGAMGGLKPESIEERLQVLGGVSEFPSRVKCATLAWHTLNAALDNTGKEASSE